MFCEEKKSKCPKKKFQSVKRGEKCLSVEFRVFRKKKKIERKVPEKKSKCFEWKLKLKLKTFGSWVTLLVGRHVVNEPEVGCYVVSKLGIS